MGSSGSKGWQFVLHKGSAHGRGLNCFYVLSLNVMSCPLSVPQGEPLDSFCGKQKENVPPCTLDLVRTLHFSSFFSVALARVQRFK